MKASDRRRLSQEIRTLILEKLVANELTARGVDLRLDELATQYGGYYWDMYDDILLDIFEEREVGR